MAKQITVLVMVCVLVACLGAREEGQAAQKDDSMTVAQAQQLITEQKDLDTIPKSVWRQILSPEEYRIMWEKGTERPFTGALLENKEEGVYVSAGCRIPVFSSSHKFKSGTGWPSFWEAVDKGNIILKSDNSWGMKRTEVLSACGEHLGHVFNDGPEPTGLRYCINSLALDFVAKPMSSGVDSTDLDSKNNAQ